ncbi:uncharacterized protein LOC125655883 [Ostrea edulis]|uniref:uncharacterized protein LOC125655883 n=1 Tax=Ostrea edulis TaxID=37623 RepID=UPI0024AF6058|nr:uncharacterized protein LOC125655883 [Ostrea edulis]
MTCQSNQTSGEYQFFYINGEGNKILYASGGGEFQSCSNNTNGSFIECDFGTSWNFSLILLNPAHNQTVYCQRSGGGQDIKNSSTTIFVQVPVSNVTLSPSSSIVLIEGTSFTFSCVSNATRPAANLTWYSDGVVVSGSSSSSSMNNLLYDVTSNLTASFKRTDNGKNIYCTPVNIDGDIPIMSTQAQVNVIYAPPAAPQLTADGSTSVDEGQSIYLRCNLSTLGNPNITWSWVCGDDTLTTGVTNSGTWSVLTLTANRKYNQRTCQCRATSPRPSLSYNRTSGTQTITVYYNNVISSNVSEGYVISEHGRLQIKCDVDGNPLSTITWLFVPNNTVIKNDSDVSSSTLDILSASCLDHGNYKVTADNGKGPVDTTTTHIAVRCKPRLDSVDVQTSDKLGIGNNESLQILVRMLLYPQATLTQWTFVGKNNESRVIQNNTGGYSITESKGENKQNISLYKRSVDTEEFGDYTIMVLNDVGNFTRTYYVDAARPPLKPTNLTLVCVTSSVKLSWISNFNGGGSQTFKISYSTEGNLLTSYKDLENINDKGYGTLHSYTPSIELQGAVWFTITVSNMFGESTSDNVHCIVKGIEEKVNHQTETIVGSVVGSVAFIVAVLVIGIFLRRRYKCTCMLKMGIERIDENVKAADMSKDESQISLAEQHEQGERNVYEELKEREAGNQYQDLSIKGNKESKTRTYENIQGSNAGNEYKENSTVSKKKDQGDQTYYNTRMVTPTDVYVNTSFQN